MSKSKKSKANSGVAAGSLRRFAKPHETEGLSILFQQGRYSELTANAAALAQRYPRDASVWKALGLGHYFSRQYVDAIVAFRKAALLAPDDAQLHNNLACALRDSGQPSEAEASCRRAIALNPGYPQAHNTLGRSLQDQGRLEAALVCYRDALRLNPNSAETHNNLGTALAQLEQSDEALECYRRALALKPEFALAHFNLGNALKTLGRLDEAVASYRCALTLQPNHAETHENLGLTLGDLGDLDGALESFRCALTIQPSFQNHCTVAFHEAYRSEWTVEASVAAALRCGELARSAVTHRYTDWVYSRQPTRLRVGLVSGDLRDHPVGYFLESVLRRINRDQLEIYLYATDSRTDAVSERLRTHCAEWIDLARVADQDAAARIHADGMHVLVDLSGFTGQIRLATFAAKPAPVQVTWLGYFATTGLAEIDYILVDPYAVSPEEQSQFAERLWFLPETRLCFTPPEVQLSSGELPALRQGYLTFGCFNNLAKVNAAVVQSWAQILTALPASKLLLKAPQLSHATAINATIERFAQLGIPPERLLLEGRAPRSEYLAAYHRVDIALDPFPYPGGTTTAEALWMGVPCLTRQGDRLLARQGVSLLSNVGLPEWIADDADAYVEKAVRFGSDWQLLAELRRGLRSRLLASPLCDAERFARHFEAALWEMWRRWDSSEPPNTSNR